MQRALSRTQFSDGQLEDLQSALAAAEDPAALPRTMASERCVAFSALDILNERIGYSFAYAMLGLLDVDKLAYLSYMKEAVLLCGEPLAEAYATAESLQARLDADLPAGALITFAVMGGFEELVTLHIKDLAGLRAARTAVAVERYRLATGNLLGSLDELVPAYMEAVPIDPFDGQPLRYKKLEKGYVVYSVGLNLADDGGAERDPEGKHGEDPDIVFIVEHPTAIEPEPGSIDPSDAEPPAP